MLPHPRAHPHHRLAKHITRIARPSLTPSNALTRLTLIILITIVIIIIISSSSSSSNDILLRTQHMAIIRLNRLKKLG
jgi:hypothetical protein